MTTLHRRNPGTRAAARVSEADHAGRLITSAPRRHGFCFAVHVRDQGVETIVGRFTDTGAAVDAAADLNAIFAETAP